jgi:hypothetical protein
MIKRTNVTVSWDAVDRRIIRKATRKVKESWASTFHNSNVSRPGPIQYSAQPKRRRRKER